MQKKTASLISFISLSVFLVLSFMPIIFTVEYWKNYEPGVGHATLWSTSTVSLFNRNIGIAVFIELLVVIGIVALIMQYAEKENKFIKPMMYAPIATTALFAVLTIVNAVFSVPNGEPRGTATSGYYGYWEYYPAWGFFIECALLIVASVLCVLIANGKLKNNNTLDNSPQGTYSAADELRKYKNLLELGAITEQEYEAKKKQLLGL